MELSFRARRVPDGTPPGRATLDPGAASPRLCHAPGGVPCLGHDVVLLGSAIPCARTFYARDSPLRPPATPHRCVPPWRKLWGILFSRAAWALWYLGYPD